LTSALDGSEWSASLCGRFAAAVKAAVTRWIEGWVDTRAGLGEWESVCQRKFSVPAAAAIVQQTLSHLQKTFVPYCASLVACSSCFIILIVIKLIDYLTTLWC
jgi:hypothetical protein